jgi:tetratricopeptide (TPR) repeat protein
MRYFSLVFLIAALLAQTSTAPVAERLATFRNLGKAFYENPTTGKEAVVEFEKALQLAPASPRERLNLALALLRTGETQRAMAELEKVQKQAPALPHTWYNLGIQWKRLGETEKALAQIEQFVKLAPGNAGGHYNLGVLQKQSGQTEAAMASFRKSAQLDPNIFAPHFQLFNLHRQAGRKEEAAAELAAFQRIKKEQEGSAIPEDMEWNFYSEVLDDAEPVPLSPAPVPLQFVFEKAAAPSATNTVLLDYDHDYDLDEFVLGPRTKLLRNQGEAGKMDRTADFPFAEPAATAGMTFRAVFETKGMDLVLIHPNKGAVLYRDQLAGRYTAQPLPPIGGLPQAFDLANRAEMDLLHPKGILKNREGKFTPLEGPGGLTAADLEGRGMLDLVTPQGIRRNEGNYRWGALVTPANWPAGVTGATAADFDNDGKMDLLLITSNGVFRALNRTATKANWLRIKLTGVKNLPHAPGSEVEVKAGGLYQKRLYDGTPITFNLRQYKEADAIRITWANGLIQNETRIAANKAHEFKEAQRLSGSCPMVWTWNGREFEYITDVLGVAPLGAASGDGSFFPVDHDEYIQIPGSALVPRDDHYEVRLTEELAEVAYLDEIKLIAVDHPAAVDLYTNDKFKSPPFPEFRLFGVEKAVRPRAARDHRGRDVLPRLLARDAQYVDGFRRTIDGLAERSHVDLDFRGAAADGRAILVLSGWVDWADGSTFLRAAQASPDGVLMPRLQVKNDRGQWQTVIEDMGMPAGKPKTIVVDLSGKWLSASREVRIVSGLALYWDEIFLSEQTQAPAVRQHALTGTAELQFRGFSPVTVHPERLQPERFAYEPVRATSMWNPTPGFYTRYGSVAPLLREADDRLVLMGSGDELRLQFPALPPPPADFRRSFLLKVQGWAKDQDANTAYSKSTIPLPFRAMKQYGEMGPDNGWTREYNTRPALRLLRPLTSSR